MTLTLERIQPRAAVALCALVALSTGCSWPPRSSRAAGDASAADAEVDAARKRVDRCVDYNPQRNLYFGDLHVHTSYSFDAYTYRNRNDPRAAYRFAKGAAIALPGTAPSKTYQLRRPLDFAAVTDHAEYLGEVEICTDKTLPGYRSDTCEFYRNLPYGALISFGLKLNRNDPQRFEFCGKDGAACRDVAGRVWKRVQQAAEEAYDRTVACRFTSFKAYEWSGFTGGSNLHRNIIFRGEAVTPRPINYFDQPTPEGLWAELNKTCAEANTGCQALSIPHNSNLGRGDMFSDKTADGKALTPAQAATRAAIEPLVEIAQHKGDSECVYQPGAEDELCKFEKLSGTSKKDSVREALKRGLVLQDLLGTNPFKLGIVGSTDTHNSIPGAVAEDRFVGAFGKKDNTPQTLLSRANITQSPGTLAAIWAEQNTREALFDAMLRKETYATSGPRIVLRFFGGWGYDAALCTSGELVKVGYRDGVPMGGDLPARPATASAPRFVVSAMRDPGAAQTTSTPLQRLQIIKGWVDRAGKTVEKVYEVAGDPQNGATVDLATCARKGRGFDALCTVWTDPDFDPALRAFYYVRVIENPSCRWNTWICVANSVDCRNPAPGFESCCKSEYPRTIQERAWSSPIWYTP